MGTNYYLKRDVCEHCGRAAETLHIGKSSYGWCFGLHVDDEHELTTLGAWREAWAQPGTVIVDEYERPLTPDAMFECITDRAAYALPGKAPFRHPCNHNCLGPGGPGYDLIRGEFS
jgi:hypothetical protein